jgi:tetratricopeptide (TPR) repeat protein
MATAQMGKALGYLERALAIQRADQDELNEARTLNLMGGAYDALSLKAKAFDSYEQAARRFETLGNPYRQAIMINNLGVIYDDWGDYQTAKNKYLEALSEFEREAPICNADALPRILNICDTKASILDNIGELSNTLGDPASALVKFNESLAIRRLRNGPQLTGSTLSRICYSHVLMAQPSEALPYCAEALDLNEKAKDLRGSAATSTFMGMIYAALNDNEKARQHFERALSRQQEAGDRRGEAVTLGKMGSLYAANAAWEKAFASFDRALQLWRDINDPIGRGWSATEATTAPLWS